MSYHCAHLKIGKENSLTFVLPSNWNNNNKNPNTIHEPEKKD